MGFDVNGCWAIVGVRLFAPVIVATYPNHGYAVAPCLSLNHDGIRSLSRVELWPSHETTSRPVAGAVATGNVLEFAGGVLTCVGVVQLFPSSVEAGEQPR